MHQYLEGLQEKFEQHRDPETAAAMKKYMKGQYDYFGIKAPVRREIDKQHIRESGMPGEDDLELVLFECWDRPEREYQYFAMELSARVAKKAEICRVDIYEYMAEHKSWWDTIDYISSNLVGVHFKKFPDIIVPYTEKWMESGNIWLQRVSILFQLKYRKDTDLALLTHYIEQLEGSREFFINKAIGWILREYSKTDPVWVQDYVHNHWSNLAPLSRREALKRVERKKQE